MNGWRERCESDEAYERGMCVRTYRVWNEWNEKEKKKKKKTGKKIWTTDKDIKIIETCGKMAQERSVSIIQRYSPIKIQQFKYNTTVLRYPDVYI